MVYTGIICRKPNTPESLADTFLSLWEAIANLQGENKSYKVDKVFFVWDEPHSMLRLHTLYSIGEGLTNGFSAGRMV